jgi:hypothetical protein
MGTEQQEDPRARTSHWQDVAPALRDRLANLDRALSTVEKYRTAIAVLLETNEHIAAIEKEDLDEIRSVLLELVDHIDLNIIKDLIL